MWQVTNSERLGTWQGYLSDANPSLIMGDYALYRQGKVTFGQIGFTEIENQEEFTVRYEIFSMLPQPLKELIDHLYTIACQNLFAGCGQYSEATYEATVNIVKLMEVFPEKLMPKIDDFIFSTFGQNNGWGNRFTKADIDKQ